MVNEELLCIDVAHKAIIIIIIIIIIIMKKTSCLKFWISGALHWTWAFVIDQILSYLWATYYSVLYYKNVHEMRYFIVRAVISFPKSLSISKYTIS